MIDKTSKALYIIVMAELKGYKICNQYFDNPLDLGEMKLVQAGRYYCGPGTVVVDHFHDGYYEITAVNGGKATVLTNDKQITIKKNDIYVNFPNDTHGIISSVDDPIQYDHLAFIIDKDGYREQMHKIALKHADPDSRIIYDRRIHSLLVDIIGEFANLQEYYKDSLFYTMCNITVCVIRKFGEKSLSAFSGNASESERLCNRIMNYIDTNIYDIEDLNDLTQITNYNYNYLSSLFKKTTGSTLRDYYLNRKLETADVLVKEGKLKICEIAEKLHYSAADAFTKAYKNKFGVPPKRNKN